ncbi:MAG: IS481 family transposase [Desulfovibrio sp.]
MNIHRNARLTLARREELVRRVAAGETPRAVATALGVSVRTVFKWLARQRKGEGLRDRSSRPRHSPMALRPDVLERVVELRRQRLTGRRIARQLGLPVARVHRALRRLALNRLKSLDAPLPPRRYQWENPGDLLHIDIKKLGRFAQVGHRAHGDRSKGRSRGAGWEFVHVAIDDASRIAFAEILADERQESVVAFLSSALRFYKRLGITVRRVMTDNGSGYVSRAFAKACAAFGLRHIRTRPYTPRTNGKAERFIQTALREWAYAASYANSNERASELPRWLHEYNFYRNHSALQDKPPICRIETGVNNVLQLHT